jgi:hypothetical protein
MSKSKYFKVKLEDHELKPKSPVREKEFEFEELMVRNTQLLMEQNKKLLEEINFLKTKVESLEEIINKNAEEHTKDLTYLANTYKDKTLPLSERILEVQKRQVRLLKEGHTVQMLRYASDGIAVIPGVNGVTTIVY